MRFFRRSLIALGIAATLPTIVFAAVGIFYFLRSERNQVETDTLTRSRTLTTLVDSELRGHLSALNVLSSSVYFENRDWKEFYGRVERVQRANQGWATIRLYDVTTGEEIFDLRRPFAAPERMSVPSESLERLKQANTALVSGVILESEPLVYLYVPVRREHHLQYVLAAGIRPQIFQDILQAHTIADTTSGVVDRDGLFVARSQNFTTRVGTPATSYVQRAIRSGNHGFYRGTTWEGLSNYTAFYTSPWSGWSAHIAVPSSLIDAPTSWSFIVAAVASLGALALGATLAVLVLRDMAERRRAEEALRQSQKMEAVGQLTGGIAHDFNNLLTAIIGNLDMIRTRAAGNERLQRPTEHALEAARRGAKLTAQLLAFSRSQRMQITPVDLQEMLTGMSGLLTQSVGPAIEVEIDVLPDARFVLSDANQLELALLNLAVNARDAMPEGGKLRISTRAAREVDVSHLSKRRYIEIRVADGGIGMNEEIRSRAIEPFFTTKPVGQGTGLGLSQVYGVLRESGGGLFIDSAVNAGTTVYLYLPEAPPVDASTAIPKDENSQALAATTPNEREHSVLVVDDDRQVRDFIAESLRSLGYRVVDVANGAAALELFNETRFDLLVVDFAMPGMNGAEVARAAQDRQPNLRVLIVSGYADSAAIQAALGEARLLRKPFDPAELGAAVAEVLNEK